jgi:drug/metabolite transporter (DMT)-like permease
MYCTLSAGATLALRQTKGSAVLLTIEACLLLYALKALLSLVLLIYKQSMSLGTIVDIMRQRDNSSQTYVWCHLALVGSLFGGYDALSFLAAQDIPPMSFQLLLNSRSLLLVPLQWCLLGKMINKPQLWALVIIGIGACALSVDDVSTFDAEHDDKAQGAYKMGLVYIAGKCLLSSLALVVNEKLLKELPLTVDAQNLVTYIFGMTFLLVGMACWAFLKRWCNQPWCTESTSVQHNMGLVLGQIWLNPWILISVLLMAVLGLVCAYLLKAYSAMDKEVLSAGVVALLALGQAVTPGEHMFNYQTVECALIIIVASFAYRQSEAATAVQVEKHEDRRG